MRKTNKTKNQRQPDGQRIIASVQHENRFDRPQVKA